MKKAHNFQITQVQSQDVAKLLLEFLQTSARSIAYKSVGYKKNVY